MKIIQVAGWSGAGKTTFISQLCLSLSRLGRVGTIKHIGEHVCDLPSGKDTTIHFQAGAEPATGIDLVKTTSISHDISLDSALNHLSDSGVRFALIEGFKQRPFTKVLIGEMETKYLLYNPSPEEVISRLPEFDDWYTLPGLIRELAEEFPGIPILSWSGYATGGLYLKEKCRNIEEQVISERSMPGIRVRIQPWSEQAYYPVYIVIPAKDRENSGEAMHTLISLVEPFCILPDVPRG